MLQLLLQSGQSYDDIGSLLGSDVSEVRERARAAFKDMGGADPDGEVSLTDYLLGQADPIARADVARHLQSDLAANALANKLASQLRLIAPGADLPEIPTPREKKGAVKAEAKPKDSKGGAGAAPKFGKETSSSSGFTGAQKRLFAGLGAGAVVVLLIVLLVTGVFSGGSDDNSDPAVSPGEGSLSSSQTASNTSDPASEQKVVGAILSPVGNADPEAKGTATLGTVKKVPVIQVIVKGIAPTAKDTTYSVWLYRSPKAAIRLGSVEVTKSRGILAQLPVPEKLLTYVSNGTFPQVDISLSKNSEILADAQKAKASKSLSLRHIGESVMRGPITGPGVKTGS